LGVKRSVPELLCPAGDLERLQTVLFYGADAVYLGGHRFNLRARTRGFDLAELSRAISMVRRAKARIYFCLNALISESSLDACRGYIHELSVMDLDGLIVSDPGLVRQARKLAPHMPLHLSTQAGTYNSEAALFWRDCGVKRVNLARELSLKEIKALARQPDGPELEMFVHGAMCMAVSGLCLLSAHLNRRSANFGQCTHPCRFDYRPRALALEESTRPGKISWQLWEEEKFSRILSAEDLCLVKFLRWITKNRIHCLKIEGRMKSVAYLGITVDVYKTALKDLCAGKFRPGLYLKELARISSRPLGSGFFLPERKIFARSESPTPSKRILARVDEQLDRDQWLVQVKSAWNSSMDLELVLPGLLRPYLAQGHYSLEGIGKSPGPVVHSGLNAILRTRDERLAKGVLLREA